jgi:hypothetical protein
MLQIRQLYFVTVGLLAQVREPSKGAAAAIMMGLQDTTKTRQPLLPR